jgi:hypothetical protein
VRKNFGSLKMNDVSWYNYKIVVSNAVFSDFSNRKFLGDQVDLRGTRQDNASQSGANLVLVELLQIFTFHKVWNACLATTQYSN